MKRRMGNSRTYVASFKLLDKKAKADSCQTPEYRKHLNNIAARSEDHNLKNTTKDKGEPLPCAMMNEDAKSTADCGKKWSVHHVESALLSEKHVELEREELRSTSMETELEEGEIRVEPKDSRFHEDHTLAKQGQEACIEISINDNLSNYIQEIEKASARRMHDLLQQQTVEKDKFKMFMEKERLKMEKENALISDLGSSSINHPYARHGNLCPLSRQSPRKLSGFHQYLLSQKRKLVALQIDARNKEKNLKQKWMTDAYNGKIVRSFDTIPLSGSEFRAESFEKVCCWGEASGCSPNITGSVILPDEHINVDSTSKDVPENNPDGEISPVTNSGNIQQNDLATETCLLPSFVPEASSEMVHQTTAVEVEQANPAGRSVSDNLAIIEEEWQVVSDPVGVEPKRSLQLIVDSVHQHLDNAHICMQESSPYNNPSPSSGFADVHLNSSSNKSFEHDQLSSLAAVEKEQGLNSPQLPASKLQPAENVNVEDPPLRNPVTGANAHSEIVLDDCLERTSNQLEPSVPHPFLISTNLQAHELCADPFQNELLRIQKEEEFVTQTREKTVLQLKLEFDNEVQKLQKKYIISLKDAEADLLSKKKSLEIIFEKLQMNQCMAEQFISNFFEGSVATASNNGRLAGMSIQQHSPGPASSFTSTKYKSVENANVEVPPLRNLVTGVNAHSESALHDCLKSTSNQWKPSVPHPFMITTYLQTHEILPDPFQNELLRIQKEKELVLEMNEKMKLQLKLEHDKEVQNLEKKYRTSLEDIEVLTLSRKNSLDIIFDKLQMNQVIAEQFLSNFFETSAATLSNNSRLSALSTQQQHPPGPASSPPSTLPVPSTRV